MFGIDFTTGHGCSLFFPAGRKRWKTWKLWDELALGSGGFQLEATSKGPTQAGRVTARCALRAFLGGKMTKMATRNPGVFFLGDPSSGVGRFFSEEEKTKRKNRGRQVF